MFCLSGQSIVIWYLDCALHRNFIFSSVFSHPGRECKVLSLSVVDDKVSFFGDLDGLRIPTRINLSKCVFESSRFRLIDDVYV